MKPIQILFENESLVVINKPAHIAVHGDGKTDEETIADWVLKTYPEAEGVGESIVMDNGTEILRHGIVHRLDKETSGALVIAKTDEAFDYLKSAFQNREIKKTYYAFIYGKMRDSRGVINRPIGRAIGSIRKWATGGKIRGEAREAITKFKVIKNEVPVSFVQLWPQTGRTHQIRVHLEALGHPVVADPLYAPTRPKLLGFDRLALHAGRIAFVDMDGKEREIEAPFPEDFQGALATLGVKL